jgi:hypothetical protein
MPPADSLRPPFGKLFAGYLGQHWLATYAVLYMQAANLAK